MDNLDRTGKAQPTGEVVMALTKDLGILKQRHVPWSWRIKNFLFYRLRDLPALLTYRFLGRIFSLVTITSALHLKVLHADGTVTDYGVVSRRVVTTAGVGYIVDAFQNIVELEEMKYHGFGTGTTGENVADTDLETELTTEYATDNIRPTGTTTEGASANIYRTVATLTPNAGGTIAVTEHGVLSDPDVGQGVLLDRSVFSAVNVVASADSLQATYELTVTAGS